MIQCPQKAGLGSSYLLAICYLSTPYSLPLNSLWLHTDVLYISNNDDAFQVVRSMITPRRLSRMAEVKLSMAEALQWLCRAEPTSRDLLEGLQAWTAKTPARVALTQVEHNVSCCSSISVIKLFREPDPLYSRVQ